MDSPKIFDNVTSRVIDDLKVSLKAGTKIQGDLAGELLHDPYNFDFLTMTEGYKEKEVKQALIENGN